MDKDLLLVFNYDLSVNIFVLCICRYMKLNQVIALKSCFSVIEQSWQLKQKIHIISSQPIRRRSSTNSFHDLSMNSVSIDVIGEFWWAMKRELVRIA